MTTEEIRRYVEQSRQFIDSREAKHGVVIGATVKLARFRKSVAIIDRLLKENESLREYADRYRDLCK